MAMMSLWKKILLLLWAVAVVVVSYKLCCSRRWNIALGRLTWPSSYGVCLPWQHLKKKLSRGTTTTAPIYVVYHIGTIKNYRKVVAEQMAELQRSGLYDLCEAILVGANGPGCRVFVASLQQKFPKVAIIANDAVLETPKTYERCTLNAMIRLVRGNQKLHPNALFCYIHSKGVTETAVAQSSWRRFMMYWVVTRHEMHRLLLGGGGGGTPYLTSGVFLAKFPIPHYAGNFFWATAAYIRTWDYLTGRTWLGRLEDEELCLKKATPGCHVTIVPREAYRLFHLCNYYDEEPIIEDQNPWVAEF